MDVALLCIASITGMCAAGFLLAAVILFSDLERPMRGWELLDLLLTQGMFSRFWKTAVNWRTHTEARGLFLTGLCFLAVTTALVVLVFMQRAWKGLPAPRLTAACVLPAVVALGLCLVPGIPGGALVAALVLGLLALPVSAIHRCHRGWPRGAMAAVAALLAVLGGAAIALLLLPTDHGLMGEGKRTGGGLLGFFLIGTFASQWIANGLMSVRPRR